MHRPLHIIAPVLLCCVCAAPGRAQIGGDGRDGPFVPGTMTLDTSKSGGVFQFTLVNIRPGVMVTITGPNPAVLLSQGDVIIDGELLADGKSPAINGGGGGAAGGPGGFAGGNGNVDYGGLRGSEDGKGPGGGHGGLSWVNQTNAMSGGGGGHATMGLRGMTQWSSGNGGASYGSALPFDLCGGSGGGGGFSTVPGHFYLGELCGAGGGGVIVILADGRIEVSGTVAARGGDVTNVMFNRPYGGGGAGGSILLRGMRGMRVQPSGSVLATGGHDKSLLGNDDFPSGGDGYVRLDAYGASAEVLGMVRPAPLVLAMPHLEEVAPPTIGGAWRIRIAALPGDRMALGVSSRGAALPWPPFGTLRIDLSQAVLGGPYDLPEAGLDPVTELICPIPNDPRFLGLRFYVQGLNFLTAARVPQLSNDLIAVIR